MLGVEGVANTPGSVGRFLWDITGGALIDGIKGVPTDEQTRAAENANLVSQSASYGKTRKINADP
jgi:hypothetical protein